MNCFLFVTGRKSHLDPHQPELNNRTLADFLGVQMMGTEAFT